MNLQQSPEFTDFHAYEPHARPLFSTALSSNTHPILPDNHILTQQPRHDWDTTAEPREARITLDASQSLAGPLCPYRSTHHAVSLSQTELTNASVTTSTGSILAPSATRTQLPADIHSSAEGTGLPQHASLVTPTGLAGFPEHYDTQHWHARLIESQYNTQPTNTASEKRPNRCFGCRQDPGNRRKCFNYPICNRCTISHSKCESGEHLQQDHFLDWRYMLSICQKLNKMSQISQTTNHQTFSGPVILEFTHYDRLQSQWEPSVVVFRPELQVSSGSLNATETECELRAPAFYKVHLDALIRDGVWGQSIWDSDRTRFSADELNLWDSVRLFIGYHSLLHNLATTFVEATEFATVNILARIIAELVYAIGFYLQFYYYEIVSTISGEETLTGRAKISPAVRLYSLEVLLRCTTSMQEINWRLSEQSTPHPLSSLERYFNTQIKHILCQFNQLECRASGESHKNRHMRPPPAMVEFAKSLPASNFPKHCIIKVYRHRPYILPVASSVQGLGDKHRGVDILTLQNHDSFVFGKSGQPSSLWYEFDHVVTHNNKVISIWEVVMASLARRKDSGSDNDDQPNDSKQADSKQADSNVSELATRLLALQQDIRAGGCLSDSNTLISVEMTGIDESPPPSLVAGTPLSMLSASSPGTPAPSVTIGSYWAWMNSFS